MQEGLYRSEFEHDSCGIGAVVDLSAEPITRDISDCLYDAEQYGAPWGSWIRS